MRSRSKGAFVVLLACAFLAYAGILNEGRRERSAVVDTATYGGRLASEGTTAFNTAFDPSSGSAAIGINYRFHSLGSWEILLPPALVNDERTRSDVRRLFIMAEDPQFFSANGYERVYAGPTLVGEIRAIRARGGAGFAADLREQPILMPPGRTFGYRFLLPDDLCSSSSCNLTIRGTWAFWHVYRFAIVGEKPRFVAASAP